MKYLLTPNITIIGNDENLLLVSESHLLRIHQPSQRLHSFLHQLQHGCTPSELRVALEHQDIIPIFTELQKFSYILFADQTSFESQIYERQFGYLALHSNSPNLAQSRLSACTIAIVGLGGIGSIVLQHLMGAGIRHFQLIDADNIEITNLNRQYIYAQQDVGKAKVAAAAEYCFRIEPNVDIGTWQQFIAAPSDLHILDMNPPDLLVLAADQPLDKLQNVINDYCVSRKVPFICGATGLERGYWGPLIVPQFTCCFTCFNQQLTSQYNEIENQLQLKMRSNGKFSFGPTNSIIASFLARDVIDYVVGAPNVLSLGTRCFMNFSKSHISKVSCSPCSCGDGVERIVQ